MAVLAATRKTLEKATSLRFASHGVKSKREMLLWTCRVQWWSLVAALGIIMDGR